MKWILFFNSLVVLGLTLADTNGGTEDNSSQDALIEEASVKHQVKRGVLKRVVRESYSDMSSQFLPHMAALIVSNCRANGHTDEANQLQTIYKDMKTCLKKKTIFITPKDEFITHYEECTKEYLKSAKTCLSDDKKYFPDFILDLTRSVINFMYDDFDIMRGDLAACIPRFNKDDARKGYAQCLSEITTQTHDTADDATTKDSFCLQFIPASHCFTNMIRDTCDKSKNLDKFREDYINAMKTPCDKKESSY